MQTIAERLKYAQQSLHDATDKAQRKANSVKLLAVSKTKSVSEITQAYEQGQRLFGENYIQEGVSKVVALSHLPDIEWHMIGPIQSNKTKEVAENFHWVQSIDRNKIARRLNEQRPEHLPNLNICIQVNIDNEDTKSGVKPDEVDELIDSISGYDRLTLRGIMAIPSASADINQQHSSFEKLAAMYEEYRKVISNFDTLSLGMSKDLALAVQHGSTMVRLGTAIFGAR